MTTLEEWEKEPNHVFFTYKSFLCEIKRHAEFLTLCGYVYLPREHPLAGKSYDDIDFSVHGGLTFAAEELDQWCIGFDCAHGGDLNPGTNNLLKRMKFPMDHHYGDVYRNMKYVTNELISLVDQIMKDTLPSQLQEFEKKLDANIAHALLTYPDAYLISQNARVT
jgi:hypothetical protein